MNADAIIKKKKTLEMNAQEASILDCSLTILNIKIDINFP